ncbi:Lipase 1 [Pseudocercospora fuligena]|uniref:Lipase 1 n=1 Tax=Pseudocercospora fuligena TaxID=685502 RepID=A0A8H6R7C0_9PEZI|nr:Lipase 1 [Pseudocercospora fuligena]
MACMAILGLFLIFIGVQADECTLPDPEDLSNFRKGAAVGDSYAAGIGAGNRLDWGCHRYDASFSNLVMLQLGTDPGAFEWSFLACSGARIADVKAQTTALSNDQEFILLSAGGNDADLVGILNSCVYSFYAGIYLPNCEQMLEKAATTIQSSNFAAEIDDLIAGMKLKLALGGHIYYVGYAKFFDITDDTCDSVSWHVWWNLPFVQLYLTQARRQAMNDLVDLMNTALRNAVAKAGSQVHFIDYDKYVDLAGGRYCLPKADESSYESANRYNLFFYKMKTLDQPWIEWEDDWPHDELKRRQSSGADPDAVLPVNNTLNALYGALIQEAIETSDGAAIIQDENASIDLDQQVDDYEDADELATAVPTRRALSGRYIHRRGDAYFNDTAVGTQVHLGDKSTANLTNIDRSVLGTVLANNTHVLLANGHAVEKSSISRLLVSDTTARVFHPTQGGHALIANLILYQMTADRAMSLGVDYPQEFVNGTGDAIPEPFNPTCNLDSSNTWTSRDAMTQAVSDFCSDPSLLRGTANTLNSINAWAETLDYVNISVTWAQDGNISQHSCLSWLGVATDGCNVPDPADTSAENNKHGGSIEYESPDVNATFSIEPLVLRQIWNGGQATIGQQCNGPDTLFYLDQPTLQANIQSYCKESAAQPPFNHVGLADAGATFWMTSNDGTPSRVDLITEWPAEGPRSFEIFEEECQYYMSVINNGCSIPDPNESLNWKHGGTMTDYNGIKYTINPTWLRPDPPTKPVGHCRVGWHGHYYDWEIWGAGFANGDWGSTLLAELQRCGNVKEWTFSYYDKPASDGTEWHASGTIPFPTWNHCIARAISLAGGFDSNC